MKLVKLSMVLAGALCCTEASAALITYSFSPGVPIPDNDPSGVGYGFVISAAPTGIESVSVRFTITAGYNGDLYAYLTHDSGFAVLLNRVGATGGNPGGYSDSGFNNVTLASGVGNDIHQYQVTLGGPGVPGGAGWAADGRLNSTDVARNNTLDVFNGANPNGDWTLFFADRSAGSISTLNTFEVQISAIPEPANVALGIVGGMFTLLQLGRSSRVRKWILEVARR